MFAAHQLERACGTRHNVRVTPVLEPAAPTLCRFVEDIRGTVHAAGSVTPVRWLPDGRTALVFRVIDEGRRGDISLAGPRTRALFKSSTGIARSVKLQFKPGWSAALLGVAASDLTDRIIPLQDLWGHLASDLCGELLAARSLPEMVTLLSRAIAVRTANERRHEPSSARLARRAVRLLEAGDTRVESVAEQLGVTARHLRRAFHEHIGVGPKEFARTVRLQRAVRMAETSAGPGRGASVDWSRIATDAGYYDQAHLIADFRELLGLTPGAFQRRTRDAEALAPAAE